MYAWMWRTMPGNAALKAVLSLLLMLVVLYLLFEHVFPWLDPRLPFNQIAPEGTEGAG